jgi:type I restriction enzyme S subunit
MFRDLPSYDRYATNDSSWLGPLPAHWITQRTKSLLTERVEKGYPEEPLLAATQRHGVIKKSDYGTRTVTASKDLHLLKLVEVDDFVISLRSFQGGIERCYHRGIISPAYTVLTARSAGYRDYLTYLFKSKPFISSLTLAVTGIREGQNIDYSTLAVDLLPVPPAEEQAAIVKYLAHGNARIDKAIAAKRRLIALLDEQRLSSVIWEGPKNGTSPEISEDGDLRTFSISVVRDGLVDVRDSDIKYVSRAAVRDPAKYHLRSGDILIVRGNGNIRLVGRAGLVATDSNDGIYPDLLMRIRLRSGVSAEYVVAALNSRSVREQIENKARTAVGTYKLNGADVRGIRLSIPELHVQQKIVDELTNIDGSYLPVSEKLANEIGLLQEFRTRLVADVVTGQVDVRAIAAMLPDAPESFDNLISELDDDFEEALSEGGD